MLTYVLYTKLMTSKTGYRFKLNRYDLQEQENVTYVLYTKLMTSKTG